MVSCCLNAIQLNNLQLQYLMICLLLFYSNLYLQFFQGFGSAFNSMRQFSQNYRCYSVSMLPGHERNDVENGGKSNLFCFVIFRNATA